MRCPGCGHLEDRVLESRTPRDGGAIRRRRQCLGCSRRFTTFERFELRPFQVVKKDGRRQPFDREKLLSGLITACRKRPVETEILQRIVDTIEQDLSVLPGGEATAEEIGERVVEALREVDPVAYVRFASVYRDFREIGQFKEIVEVLGREATGTA